jgi:hypothetical protein
MRYFNHILIKSFCLRRQSVSMPFTGVELRWCRSARTLTDKQDTVLCCVETVCGFVCPLSVGKHPCMCTLKPMRNAGFQMWRYRIRSTRIFNLPLDSPPPTPSPLPYSPVHFYSSVMTHYHGECDLKRIVCFVTHVTRISILRDFLFWQRSWWKLQVVWVVTPCRLVNDSGNNFASVCR